MAGSQQQQIVDTIFGLKRRLLRKDDSSDSDETASCNPRTQNLKRKAQYTRNGKPETASDPPPYKKHIEHAGFHRYILHRNPSRYDPDGDIVEPGDEYEDEDELSTVEEDPYADIKLEELLAPLTSAADLPNHPSYSTAYTSKHLTNLASEAGAMSRKEQISLWSAKNLFDQMLGDLSYVPNGLPDISSTMQLQESYINGTSGTDARRTNGASARAPQPDADGMGQEDIVMGDVEQTNGTPPKNTDSNDTTTTEPQTTQSGTAGPVVNGNAHNTHIDAVQANGSVPESPLADETSDTASQHTAHRMTTRARAHIASDPSPPSSPSSTVYPVHPLFMFNTDALPDRDLGLPANEGDETRMMLLAFVQKQEEITRITTDLYTGILRGERMKQDVFKWCKADAHVGEMSDGEDWYDREDWELEEDLVKGRDEEEDETAVAGKKSTRQRRKPDKEDR